MERKTADDIRFCEVVQDLLPSLCGWCAEAWEHGTGGGTPENLRRLPGPAEPDAEPLALDAAAAKPVTKNAPNMTAKRAFKKVEAGCGWSSASALQSCWLSLPASLSPGRPAWEAACASAAMVRGSRRRRWSIRWVRGGVDAFVAQMEPTLLYQDHITPVGDTELCDKLGIPYVLREDETWVSRSLGLLGRPIICAVRPVGSILRMMLVVQMNGQSWRRIRPVMRSAH